MRALLGVAILALSVLPSAAAAGTVADLDSAAPVLLFGAASATGSHLLLFHDAFENGSLSGTIYAGRIIDHQRHLSCGRPPVDQDVVVANASAGSVPSPIYFQVDQNSMVLVDYADQRSVSIGSGPATDADRSGGSAIAALGPDPYPLATQQQPTQAGANLGIYAHAFPTTDFLAVPNRELKTLAKATASVELGNVTVIQEGQSKVLSAFRSMEQVDCSPTPFLPSSSSNPVYHTIIVVMDSGTVDVRQDRVDDLVAVDHGDRPSTPPRMTQAPVGYWPKETPADAGSLGAAYRSYGLPATLVSAPDLGAQTEGVARFANANGNVHDGGLDRTVQNDVASLSGSLTVRPDGVKENGRAMHSIVEGSLYHVDAAPAPGSSRDYSPYLAGAAGGALVLGLVVYAWPSVKWGAAKWLAAPLYARLRKEEILENPLRDDILQAVQDEPGISASELGRRMECGWGTLVYHLTVLERMQLVSSAREGRHKRFFAQGRINYSEKGAVALLANPAARIILDAIRGNPGLIQKELSERLQLSPGTVAWHVDRLQAEGLVVREDLGRTVRYYPSERLLDLTRRLAA